ncbi:hypothetical protein BC827DRAFT_1239255 [Russula dissimulans]|nr:hypothetical protein BC827DRAFT_1239255 [Russula dissimulans]
MYSSVLEQALKLKRNTHPFLKCQMVRQSARGRQARCLPQKQKPLAPTNPRGPEKMKMKNDSDGTCESKQFEKSP